MSDEGDRHRAIGSVGRALCEELSRSGWAVAAQAISALHGHRWPIEPSEDLVYDQRLLDPRLWVASLASRLPRLRDASP